MSNVTIYVNNGFNNEFKFYIDASGESILEPESTLYLDSTYTFYRLGTTILHPFYISDAGVGETPTSAITLKGDGSETSGITSSESFTLTFNTLTTTDTLTYFSTNDDSHSNTFTVLDVECLLFSSPVNLLTDSDGEKKYVFNEKMVYDSKIRYSLSKGTYILENISKLYPIAIKNAGKEDLISYTGVVSYPTYIDQTADDGNTYSFYHGTVTITVEDDFDLVSFCVYDSRNKEVVDMGGLDIFVYREECVIVKTFTIDTDNDVYSSIGPNLNGVVTITFSEPVSSLDTTKITSPYGYIENMTLQNDGYQWVGDFTMTTSQITVADNILVMDSSAFGETEGVYNYSNCYVVDDVSPSIESMYLSTTTFKIGTTAEFTIVFSEKVILDTDYFSVSNGELSNFCTSDYITWTATFTPDSNVAYSDSNVITLSTPESSYYDLAKNSGTISMSTDTYIIDTQVKLPIVKFKSCSTKQNINNTFTVLLQDEIVYWEYSLDSGNSYTEIQGNSKSVVTLPNNTYNPYSIIIRAYDEVDNMFTVTNSSKLVIKTSKNGFPLPNVDSMGYVNKRKSSAIVGASICR